MTDLVKSSAKKAKTHQRYYVIIDGKKKRVPGTTTITGVMDKPALVYWANNLGLEGINVRDYVDDLANAGTCAHLMCELNCLGYEEPVSHEDMGQFTGDQIKLAKIGYEKFLNWKNKTGFIATKNEVQLTHDRLLYGGTVDIVGYITKDYVLNNGITLYANTKLLIDLKTSKACYGEQKTQVCAYGMLLEHNNISYDHIIILRIGRNEEEGFEDIFITEQEKLNHQKRFKICRNLYELNKYCK